MKEIYTNTYEPEYADTVFLNGKVITVNSRNEIAEAVAVKENKIKFCGSKNRVKDWIGSETEVIDLNGRILMPGFIDSHMHFQVMGMLMGPILNVNFENAESIKDIQKLIADKVKDKKPGEWIVCAGYDNNKLKEKRHPGIEELDVVAPDNPVRVGRCDGHMGVCNSLALKIAGISADSGPSDEVIVENGKLTGLLKEMTFINVANHFQFTEEDLLEGLKAGNELMLKYGITTVHDAGLEGPGGMRFIETASRAGDIKVRLHVMISDLSGFEKNERLLESYIKTGLTSGFGNERFSIGPFKIITDGSSSGPTCVMKEPFSHDSNLKGFPLCTPEDAERVLTKAHNAGNRITGHAQGDFSIDFLLDIIGKIMNGNQGTACRPRIEHAGMMTPALIEKMKKYNVIPTPNPGFIELYGSDYKRFYGERVGYMYPLKSYLDAGIPAAIGSDAPVNNCNPMLALYGAVTRTDSRTKEIIGEKQKINIIDAIRMYTYNGAYASFEEKIKGSIETGKLADLIVLSEDILSVDCEDIRKIEVDLTMIDGEIVYRR